MGGGCTAETNGNAALFDEVEPSATVAVVDSASADAALASTTGPTAADTATSSQAAGPEMDTEVILVEAQRDAKREAPVTGNDAEQQLQVKKTKRYEATP